MHEIDCVVVYAYRLKLIRELKLKRRLADREVRGAEPTCRASLSCFDWVKQLSGSSRYLLVCGKHAAVEVHTAQNPYPLASARTFRGSRSLIPVPGCTLQDPIWNALCISGHDLSASQICGVEPSASTRSGASWARYFYAFLTPPAPRLHVKALHGSGTGPRFFYFVAQSMLANFVSKITPIL